MENGEFNLKKYKVSSHYYGNVVRTLFIVAGLVMLVSLPFVKDEIMISPLVAVLGILVVVLGAGLINPLQTWAMALNAILAVLGFIVFEYQAVVSSSEPHTSVFFFSQLTALVFFLAIYYGIKTIRGRLVNN